MNFTEFKSELKEEFGIPEYKANEILLFLQRRIREKLTRGIEISPTQSWYVQDHNTKA